MRRRGASERDGDGSIQRRGSVGVEPPTFRQINRRRSRHAGDGRERRRRKPAAKGDDVRDVGAVQGRMLNSGHDFCLDSVAVKKKYIAKTKDFIVPYHWELGRR